MSIHNITQHTTTWNAAKLEQPTTDSQQTLTAIKCQLTANNQLPTTSGTPSRQARHSSLQSQTIKESKTERQVPTIHNQQPTKDRQRTIRTTRQFTANKIAAGAPPNVAGGTKLRQHEGLLGVRCNHADDLPHTARTSHRQRSSMISVC